MYSKLSASKLQLVFPALSNSSLLVGAIGPGEALHVFVNVKHMCDKSTSEPQAQPDTLFPSLS